jgi:predicted ATPase/DNA-binding SARP family transcriptional activator
MASARAEPPTAVRVDVLGPLRLFINGAAVDVRGPKRRAVLALLALAEGRTVTADYLVDALWPAEPPESGRAALHSHVSRLRGHLGAAAGRLTATEGGYRLRLGTDELDAARARVLLTDGRGSARSDPARRVALLRAARALWRGPVLAELNDVAPIAAKATALEELHREVTDLLIACAIEAGEVDDVVALAKEAFAADPLREPAVLLLMRALAATGQAPQALQIGRGYRRQLANETGLDPSPALAELERGVASGDVGPVHADKAPAARPLPAVVTPTTRLIGRDAHVAALRRLLATERLVTVVGPGGVGKTRLALEVARRANATGVLSLATVTDPSAVPRALAATLGLQVSRGDILSACIALLGTEPALLLIDNCEHLLDPLRELAEVLLDGCPRLTVLATSREPLGLAAERAFRLAPLALPSPSGSPERVPSVALFLDRAARVRPGFAADHDDLALVVDIVRRLDGMPLAIELAAGRLSTFSLADLHARLDRSLDLLGGGPTATDSRHRTLRATVDWSYELLTADEQRLFRHLSVFVDGVDLVTVEEIAADLGLAADPGSSLARLVDASMINVTFEGRPRYRMLETLRTFGIDRLAATDEDDAAVDRLLRWAVELTAWIDAASVTEREPDADAVLRRELGNLGAAWRVARRRRSLNAAAAMVIALVHMASFRDVVETRVWAEELVADPALETHPRQASVLGAAASVAYHRGDYALADQLAHRGLEVAADAEGSRICLTSLSLADNSRGAFADAVEHSLAASALGDRPTEAFGIAALAAIYGGDLGQARELNDRLGTVAVSPTLRALSSYVAAEIDTVAGYPDHAESEYLCAIKLARSSGATFLVGVASVGLLRLRTDAGRIHDALRGFRDVVDYFVRTGNWTHLWVTFRNLAHLLRSVGDPEPAALLDAAADQAPDAPPPGIRPATAIPPSQPPVGRARVLEIARQAIERNLARS